MSFSCIYPQPTDPVILSCVKIILPHSLWTFSTPFCSQLRQGVKHKEHVGSSAAESPRSKPFIQTPPNDRHNISPFFQAKLTKKYKVQGIPSLVMVEGKTGKLITTDGRNNMLDDPEGEHFPWYPQPLSDFLKGPLRCGAGTVDSETALKGKVTGLYFSAHWVSKICCY